ncbi:3-keto-disaccharide hydrolase [Spirosoma foliorum]|uniref:DUF1080 domain-containing protein n=1 Tax=Spirosoma foliorum TaxID=2710596 RepID=A0A7G5GVQ0_9BACT|nr:DUF1080 domain-containing protein [Spirosoma foliorum]QMW02942.1 DUF1080 domain-containing protein [Spirosoma foliorum]
MKNRVANHWLIVSNLLLVTTYGLAATPPIRNESPRITQQAQPNTANGWRQLFNGTDLTGWKHVGKGSMSVENGLIRGHGGMGLLYWTKEKFGNCTIRVVYKMQKTNSNSGVYIRIPLEPREEWMPVHYGYEVQIDNHPETSKEDDTHITGTLYSLNKPLAKPGKPGPEWNTMEITLNGPRTIISVNGVKVTDYKEGDPVPARKFDFEPYRGLRPNEGYIGLQNHGEHDVVFFKEVSVKPLSKN